MAKNRGKQFERKFAEDFRRAFSKGTLDRLVDSMSGYKTISNISDFIGYNYPYIYYLEIKSHEGNLFPLSNLTQYDKLVTKINIKGVRAGVIIWFIDFDRVIYVPISTIKTMKKDNIKSVNLKKIDEQGYKYYEIPSVKKRVFLESDYSILSSLLEGE